MTRRGEKKPRARRDEKLGPNGAFEARWRAKLGPHAVICGVDEAGRGPLAGPVVAAAAAFAEHAIDVDRLRIDGLAKLTDSKALSVAARDALYGALLEAAASGALIYAVAAASVREIDALNVLKANDLAMRRAVSRLARPADVALIDGNRAPPGLPCVAQTIVKGDARCLSIAAASIFAKVTRDRIMRRLATRHPGFGWERNAGYPTAAHRAEVARRGPTPHHRLSFSGVKKAVV